MPQTQPCRLEDQGRSHAEKPPAKQPAFQIHVDEPDGACSKTQTSTKKATVECSPLALNPTVTRLRQPLATIELPMDLSFGKWECCCAYMQYWMHHDLDSKPLLFNF